MRIEFRRENEDWQSTLRLGIAHALLQYQLDLNQTDINLSLTGVSIEEMRSSFLGELERRGITAKPFALQHIDFNEPPEDSPDNPNWIYTANCIFYRATIRGVTGYIAEVISGKRVVGFSFFQHSFNTSTFFDMSKAKASYSRAL